VKDWEPFRAVGTEFFSCPNCKFFDSVVTEAQVDALVLRRRPQHLFVCRGCGSEYTDTARRMADAAAAEGGDRWSLFCGVCTQNAEGHVAQYTRPVRASEFLDPANRFAIGTTTP
jgi:transcription elongation factor Elf1